ncbi:MAG: carbohydrate kinase family protein [Puniceicoccales bacterium]|jgi:hypothetical protein|nr:carbohydrate kinase family protein [Puniceicoccales bacterium]
MTDTGDIYDAMRTRRVLVGFDGFVDTIVHAVAVRHGEHYDRIWTITDFGKRIISAAGKSSNVELVPQSRRIGGNGPLLANALCNFAVNVRYIGTLGDCERNIFRDFAAKTRAISIGDYSETRAVEFSDGKILFGEMLPLCSVAADDILSKISREDLVKIMETSDAFALTNWTMTAHLTEIAQFFAHDILPLCEGGNRVFFFDLADPEKRQRSELVKFLETIKYFEKFGRSVLGLNIREAQQVLRAIGENSDLSDTRASLEEAAVLLRKCLRIELVFIHGVKVSAAATGEACAAAEGYFVADPKISTGAGDHYNAGFLATYLCGCGIDLAVNFAAAAASFYVKTAQSPSIGDVKF